MDWFHILFFSHWFNNDCILFTNALTLICPYWFIWYIIIVEHQLHYCTYEKGQFSLIWSTASILTTNTLLNQEFQNDSIDIFDHCYSFCFHFVNHSWISLHCQLLFHYIIYPCSHTCTNKLPLCSLIDLFVHSFTFLFTHSCSLFTYSNKLPLCLLIHLFVCSFT